MKSIETPVLKSGAVEVVLQADPISFADIFDSWMASIKNKIGARILQNLTSDTDHLDRYIEIAELRELPGAFVVCAFYQRDINDALTRMGLYMGAGKGLTAGTIVSQDDFTLLNYKKLVAGHNLPGSTVLDFFKTLDGLQNTESRANAAEQAFAQGFLTAQRLRDLGQRFYVIGFSIQTPKDQKGVVSHEIYHAYYFLTPGYREIVREFWQHQVSHEDQKAITLEIGRAYNVESEDLVIDEFQAYLVQHRAQTDRMKLFVPKYRARLLSMIEQAKIQLPPF